MPPNLQAIKADIEEILASYSSGSRVQVDGPQTLVIYHCNHWDDTLEYRIYSFYPVCNIRLQSSSLSLSGFKVILEFPRTYIYHWIAAILILLVLVYLGRDEIRLFLSSFSSSKHYSLASMGNLTNLTHHKNHSNHTTAPFTSNPGKLTKPTSSPPTTYVKDSQEYKRLTRKSQTQQVHQDKPEF